MNYGARNVCIPVDRSTSLEGLAEGPLEVAESFWRSKWETLKVKAQSLMGDFLKSKETLLGYRKRMNRLLDAIRERREIVAPATAQKAEIIANQIQTNIDAQGRLEGEVRQAAQRVEEIKAQLGLDEPSHLGIIPVAAVAVIGAALAAVAIVAGKVIVHTQKVSALGQQLALVEAGVLTPAELESIKKTELPVNLLAALSGSIPILLGLSVAAYFFFRGRR